MPFDIKHLRVAGISLLLTTRGRRRFKRDLAQISRIVVSGDPSRLVSSDHDNSWITADPEVDSLPDGELRKTRMLLDVAHICAAKGGAVVGSLSGTPGLRAANPYRSGASGCPIQAKLGWGISFSSRRWPTFATAQGEANVGLLSGAPRFRAANPYRNGALGCPIQAKLGWGISFSSGKRVNCPTLQKMGEDGPPALGHIQVARTLQARALRQALGLSLDG